MALASACSGVDEGTGSSESAIAEAGRWKLSAAALTAGANVRLDYDEAPRWTGTTGCEGGLKTGGKKLGAYLLSKFPVTTSVGGYACRRNTADTSRMSVHGSGRALDVFVPRTGGSADNGQGDKVANWLVANAQRIGVQLIIWDRSIWRANGTNDSAYGGPHPHDDHIHVELTNEGGAASMPWFLDMADDGDAGMTTTVDTGDDDDAGTTQPPRDSGAGDANKDAGTSPPEDAGRMDASPVEPPESDPAKDPPSTSPVPKGDTLPDEPSSGDPADVEGEDDGPGETDSISKPKRKSSSTLDDAPMPNAGCAAARMGPGSNPATGVAALAFALGFAAMRRRRNTRRS